MQIVSSFIKNCITPSIQIIKISFLQKYLFLPIPSSLQDVTYIDVKQFLIRKERNKKIIWTVGSQDVHGEKKEHKHLTTINKHKAQNRTTSCYHINMTSEKFTLFAFSLYLFSCEYSSSDNFCFPFFLLFYVAPPRKIYDSLNNSHHHSVYKYECIKVYITIYRRKK